MTVSPKFGKLTSKSLLVEPFLHSTNRVHIHDISVSSVIHRSPHASLILATLLTGKGPLKLEAADS